MENGNNADGMIVCPKCGAGPFENQYRLTLHRRESGCMRHRAQKEVDPNDPLEKLKALRRQELEVVRELEYKRDQMQRELAELDTLIKKYQRAENL